MESKAATVEEYLSQLPDDRRAALTAVRDVILRNLPEGYEECMQYGMIGYVVPHRIFPAGYHCDPRQPLSYAMLGNQKNYLSLYLMSVYGDLAVRDWFVRLWTESGKKLDMGKSCIRFKKAEDLPLDVIGQTIARVPVEAYLQKYQQLLKRKR